MEVILCALKCEAKPIQAYFNDQEEVVVCGPGAKHNLDFMQKLGANDHVTNIGICAGAAVGNIFQIAKIYGQRIYYPELISNSVETMPIKTIDKIASSKMVNKNPGMLFDQEAAHIYESAKKFIGPHQISFLKIVSDAGLNPSQTKNFKLMQNQIENMVKEHLNTIERFIHDTNCALKNAGTQKPNIDNQDLEKYIKLLRCSVSMQNRLMQQLRYGQICNAKVDAFFEALIKSGRIPVMHKKEGSKILDELDKYLTGE